MGCNILNIAELNSLAYCETTIGGIKDVYIGFFDESLYSTIKINNNSIYEFNTYSRFVKIPTTQSGTKYTDSYNFSTKNYEFSFDIEINKVDYVKRLGIDSLVKGKFIIVYTDYNGNSFMIGEKNGLKAESFTSTTEFYKGKNTYNLRFTAKQSYLPYGVDSNIITGLIKIDCSVLNNELALSSTLYINPFFSCIVGDLPNFI